jgi:spoIIIJ-associated protein
MRQLQVEAKTVEEAIDEALKRLGLQRDDVEVEVIEGGSRGILGFMSKMAKVNVKEKMNPLKKTEEFIKGLVNKLGVDPSISINEDSEGIKVQIEGKNVGVLIGKRGYTLEAIQYLTNLVVNRVSDEYKRIVVDVENYRKRRQESLEKFAINMANKVKQTRREVVLEPMIPNERRIIHTVLQGDSKVNTKSIGEEPNRRVIISPKK